MFKKLITLIVFTVLLSMSAFADDSSISIMPVYPLDNNDLTCYVNGEVCNSVNACVAHWTSNGFSGEKIANPLSSIYTSVGSTVTCTPWIQSFPNSFPAGSASVIINSHPPINTPPTISDMPDVTMPEDSTRGINLYASDPDGDPLTWTVSGNTNINVIITNGIATLTPNLNWNGQETLTFTVSDGRGGFAFDNVIVTVTPVDEPIGLNDIPNIVMDENTVYILDLTPYIIDVDGDLQDIIVTGNTNIDISLDFANRLVTLTPNSHWYGSELLTVQVLDQTTSAADQFRVTVNQINHPPVINSYTPAQLDVDVYEGDNLLFGVTAADPEGVSPTYRWELDTVVVGTGAAYLYNAVDGPNTHELEVFISDGINTITNSWDINELNVNPTANANDPYFCLPGTTINLRGSATDPGINDISPGSYSWDLDNDGIYTGIGQQIIPLGCPDVLGILHMTLRVIDKDGGIGIDRFDVIVRDNLPNNQPYFDPHLTNQNAIVNQEFIYDINAYDADQNDVLTYSTNSALVTINSGTGIINFIPATTGIIPVAITVCDNKAMPNSCATETFNIFVSLTGNNAPTVQITSPNDGASFNSGASITFNGIGTDIEDGALSGNSLVWTSSIDGLIGTGNTFSRTLSAGTHVITLTGTDSDGATGTDIISITVSAASSQCSDGIDNDNDGRIDLNDPGCSNSLDNDETDPVITPQCSDGIDNDNDGRIDYPSDPGCVSAGDTSEGHAPVALAGNDITTTVNTLVRFNGSASYDLDGTIVSYSWTFGDGSTANTANAQHTYTTAGTYTVTLTVRDNEGLTGTDTLIVSVGSGGGTGINTGYTNFKNDRHEFIIKEFKVVSEVNAGQDVKLLVEIENLGTFDEEINLKLKSSRLLLIKDFGNYEVEEGDSKLVFLLFSVPKDASGKYNLELEASNEDYKTTKYLEIDTNARQGFIDVLTGSVAGYNVEIEKESSVWIWLILVLILLVLISLGIWRIYKNE